MSRQLTTEQIDELYEFCYFNSIPYYDVQVEVVDHLASSIEELWRTNPDISFDNAVYLANQQLGGHAGFVIIREEKELALKKRYRRMLLGYVAEFYRLPKILVTLGLSLLIYLGFLLAENDAWVMFPLLIVVNLFAFYYMFFYFHKHVRIKVSEGHVFLLNKVLSNGVASKMSILSASLLSFSIRETHLTPTGSLVYSLITSMFFILMYADCFYMPKKIREHFNQEFPQFITT